MNRSRPLPAPRFFPSRISGTLLFLLPILLAFSLPGVASARGWLGVSVQDITPELFEAMELSVRSGALVSEVVPDSPAEEAGLMPRDVILRVNDTEVEYAEELVEMFRGMEHGDTVRLTISRDGEERVIETELGIYRQGRVDRRPWRAPSAKPKEPFRRGAPLIRGPHLGVHVYTLDENLAAYFSAEPQDGLLVLKVEPGSSAEEAGIHSGDLLSRFNGREMASPADLRRIVGRLQPGDGWTIEGLRDGKRVEFEGRFDRGAFSETLTGIRSWLSEHRNSESPAWAERQLRRLNRELDRLRNEVRDLERKIERNRDR